MPANRCTIVSSILSVCYSCITLADVNAVETNPLWYQIEIIVFAIEKPTDNTERWPITQRTYPTNMVSIAPYHDEDLSPHTLGQLEQIQRHNQLLSTSRKVSDTKASHTQVELKEELPFESIERHQLTPPSANEVSTLNNIETATTRQNEPLDPNTLFAEQIPEIFRAVASNERNLNAIVRSLNRSPLYRLLLHVAWRQPVQDNAHAIPVLLQAGKHYDELHELEGTLTVSRARYLHVASDLWFTTFMPNFSQQSDLMQLNLPNNISQQYPKVIAWESHRNQYLPVQNYRLQQSRKIHRSTLHFFDHPYFSLLINIKNHDQP